MSPTAAQPFSNPFTKRYAVVNIGQLQAAIDHKKLDPKKAITGDVLLEAGLIKRLEDGVRVLGKGELKAKVTIEAVGASKGAVVGIQKAGGTLKLLKVESTRPGTPDVESSQST